MFFFFQAQDGIRYIGVTGVQTCALPIYPRDGWAATLDTPVRDTTSSPGLSPVHTRWVASAQVSARIATVRPARPPPSPHVDTRVSTDLSTSCAELAPQRCWTPSAALPTVLTR